MIPRKPTPPFISFFNNSPLEIIFHVLAWFDLKDLDCISLINHQLYSMARDNTFWEQKCKKHFSYCYSSTSSNKIEMNWYNEFRKKYFFYYKYYTQRERQILYWLLENNFSQFCKLNLTFNDINNKNTYTNLTLLDMTKQHHINNQELYNYFYRIVIETGNKNLLVWALKCRQSFSQIKELIEQGENISQETEDFESPLLQATKENRLDIVNYFISIFPDTDLGQLQFNKLLSYAIQYNKDAILKILLDLAKRVNLIEYSAFDLALQAAKNNKLSMLQLIILNGKKININQVEPHSKKSLLHIACEQGNLEMVEYLIKQKVNIHLVDHLQQTALDIAFMNQHANIILYFENLKNSRKSYLNNNLFHHLKDDEAGLLSTEMQVKKL